jgi:hypothetical protein
MNEIGTKATLEEGAQAFSLGAQLTDRFWESLISQARSPPRVFALPNPGDKPHCPGERPRITIEP